MLLSRRWPILSAPAITVVILGTGMLVPSVAKADCGNYIVYTNPAHAGDDAPPMGEHPAPVGCHGPNCSKVPPAMPIPQVPPTVRTLGEEPLVPDDGASITPASPQLFWFDPSAGDTIRRPADVYHPPR
jgi:hypothetical protein